MFSSVRINLFTYFYLLIVINGNIDIVSSVPVRIQEGINNAVTKEGIQENSNQQNRNVVKRSLSLGDVGILNDLYYDAISEEYEDLIANKVKLLWYGNGKQQSNTENLELDVQELTTRKTWYPNLPIS